MFEIIITTYKRPLQVLSLVHQMQLCEPGPESIIIVDASDQRNKELESNEGIKYIKSSHKNQPYQRYLGFRASQSEILVFLDDDLEIIDNKFLYKIAYVFNDQNISAIALKFRDKNRDSSLSRVPKSKFFNKHNLIKNIKDWVTGYPSLKPGEFGLCGNKGEQPIGGGRTEWVSGGAFTVRREAIFRNFNFQILDIFEERLGMGEDTIIGYSLSKHGIVYFLDELFFLHNDQNNSTYSNDLFSFAKRVAYSRLYLSLERARLNHESVLFARIHYNYYMLWRTAGVLANYMLYPSRTRLITLKGTILGWLHTINFKFSMNPERFTYWDSEATVDLS